jgi:peptidoglycan/LPS O-acetylase OafA/YrhL
MGCLLSSPCLAGLADEPVLFVDRVYLSVDFFFPLSGIILASRHAREFVGG